MIAGMGGDENQAAFGTVQSVIAKTEPQKNPAAVELGRRGGQKGGKARAAALSPERRAEIAPKVSAARWGEAEARTRSRLSTRPGVTREPCSPR